MLNSGRKNQTFPPHSLPGSFDLDAFYGGCENLALSLLSSVQKEDLFHMLGYYTDCS